MKKAAVVFFLIIGARFSYCQIKIDTFNISVEAGGTIAATHFYLTDTAGPLVLFSGGCNANQGKYLDIANQLATQGFHVVTYDLRGHGKSTAKLTSDEPPRDLPPIHSQETHDGLEFHHKSDLASIYEFAKDLDGVERGRTILSLSGCIMAWSFEMISDYPEIKKFILLTSYFGEEGEEYFLKKSDFEILAVLTQDNVKFANLMKEYFGQNKNHNVHQIHCEAGWSETVFEKCRSVQQKMVDWVIRISKETSSSK